jgi:hypothetical protein
MAPLILSLGTRWEVGGQLHAPAILSLGKNPATNSLGACVRPTAGLRCIREKPERLVTTCNPPIRTILRMAGLSALEPIFLPRPALMNGTFSSKTVCSHRLTCLSNRKCGCQTIQTARRRENVLTKLISD